MIHRPLMEHWHSFSFEYGSMSLDILGYHGRDAFLFVDAGFKAHGELLKAFANYHGLSATELVISHLHKDHYQGALGLMPRLILGPSIDEHSLPEELLPMKHIYKEWKKGAYLFEGCEMTQQTVGGHSGCSQLIILDQKCIHIGDLIILAADGTFSLPLVMGRIEDYLMVLKHIVELHLDGFLGHGGYVPFKKLVYGAQLTMDYLHELQLVECSPEFEELVVFKQYRYSNAKYHAFNWRYHRGKTHV